MAALAYGLQQFWQKKALRFLRSARHGQYVPEMQMGIDDRPLRFERRLLVRHRMTSPCWCYRPNVPQPRSRPNRYSYALCPAMISWIDQAINEQSKAQVAPTIHPARTSLGQ